MEPITWLFVAVTAVVVFVIATAVLGREAHRLDAVAPRAVYRPDEAVEFVADRLPERTQARLTLDELEMLLVLHLRWLHERGLQPDDPVDHVQDIDAPVVIDPDVLVAVLLGAAADHGVELLDDEDVVHVVGAHLAYFDAIGAVGPEATDPDV